MIEDTKALATSTCARACTAALDACTVSFSSLALRRATSRCEARSFVVSGKTFDVIPGRAARSVLRSHDRRGLQVDGTPVASGVRGGEDLRPAKAGLGRLARQGRSRIRWSGYE